MPQKKNPDVAELVRGKIGPRARTFDGMLTLMKGQPLAYNKDNQEDKEPLFDTVDTVEGLLACLRRMMPPMTVKRERTAGTPPAGFSTATDLADYLVRTGLAFRDAHEVVGQAGALTRLDNGKDLSGLVACKSCSGYQSAASARMCSRS